MHKDKKALVIGTATATSQAESGASLRLHSISSLLENAGFAVTYASPRDAKIHLTAEWDVIAVVSFSSAKYLKSARRKTDFLWFDPTDSWLLSRISLLRAGDLRQMPALFRDLFYLWTTPKLDAISFITKRDTASVQSWLRKKTNNYVIPNSHLERSVELSKSPRLVFMGDGKYVPNQKALAFLQSTFANSPLLNDLHIYGDGFAKTSQSGIFHGYVEGASQLRTSDIHLAPIFYGAGMKMKVALPLINGLSVITTAEGAVGFKNHPNLHIANSSAEFKKIAQDLINQKPNENKSSQIENVYSADESQEFLNLLKQKFAD